VVLTTGMYQFYNNTPLLMVQHSLLYLPETTKINGMILYFHPTVFSRFNGPSTNNDQYKVIAGFYASQGYGVLMPDNLGF